MKNVQLVSGTGIRTQNLLNISPITTSQGSRPFRNVVSLTWGFGKWRKFTSYISVKSVFYLEQSICFIAAQYSYSKICLWQVAGQGLFVDQP